MEERKGIVARFTNFVKKNTLEVAILGAAAVGGMMTAYKKGHDVGVVEGESNFCTKLVTSMLEDSCSKNSTE